MLQARLFLRHNRLWHNMFQIDLVNLASSNIFVCRLQNVLVGAFFLFSRDVALAFSGLFFPFIYNVTRF